MTHRPLLLGICASAQRRLGQLEPALETLQEALAQVERSGERWWEAELHRLAGDVLLALERRREAEARFRRALAVARTQDAKSLELRAALSLAGLCQTQGRGGEARPLLAEVYGWFTEGVDTRDLQEAKALLERLR